jgi:hypothetical protein
MRIWLLALLLAPALAAAAAAIVLAPPRGESRDDERPAAPSPTPEAIAPSRALEPGQYLYTRSHQAYLTTVADAPGYSVLMPGTRELWMALDGTGWA